MGLELVRLPDPLDAATAEAAGGGHLADAPVGAARWLLVQGLVHDLLDGLRIQRWLAPWTGSVSPQPVDAFGQIALLPAGHRDLALTNQAGDRHHPSAVSRQKDNPCPPDQLLRHVPPVHPPLRVARSAGDSQMHASVLIMTPDSHSLMGSGTLR